MANNMEASCDDPAMSKEATCKAFKPLSECSDTWEGKLRDLFSPDDACPNSTRYIDLRGGVLEVSASETGAGCSSSWGRHFSPHSSVHPTIAGGTCTRQISFLSKVPATAPEHALAERGALNFTVSLGTACGRKVLRWSGVYDGKGGEWPPGHRAPALACDNFWLFAHNDAHDLEGNYSDPNHPGCPRTILVDAPDGRTGTVTGADAPRQLAACDGNTDVAWGPLRANFTTDEDGGGGKIIVDFRPKDGPADITGTWGPHAIVWADGNVWTKQ